MPESAISLIAFGGALACGLLLGWLLRGARNSRGVSVSDWRIRLETRDRELRDTQVQLASLIRAVGVIDGEIDAASRLMELGEELSRTDEELDRLRALEVDKYPASGSMSRRLEELEVELATLESMRCSDPTVHRRLRSESA
jgi:hypothetical protein